MAETIPGPSEIEQPQAPFLCPHCGEVGEPINMTGLGTLLIFWHEKCKHILNVQLIAMPQQAQSRIVVPGRVS